MLNLKKIEEKLTVPIFESSHPWSKFLLHSPGDAEYQSLKKQILNHEKILHLKNQLINSKSGIFSLDGTPSDFRQSNSFYWILQFFSDLKIPAEELEIKNALLRLQLYQTESGQFQLQYNEKKHQSIELVCMTAHLLDCFINLDYKNSNTIIAGINFLLATQKKDGSWHCDQNYLDGEKYDHLPGCPGATIFAIRALSHFSSDTSDSIAKAIQFIESFSFEKDFHCPWLGTVKINFEKLRYPPTFVGLDLLNLFDTLSLVSHFAKSNLLWQLLKKILSKIGFSDLLISDKRLPFWRNFDFGHNKNESTWITALFVRALRRIIHA